jgi:tetratricopeptide (TPR) repeat protein
MSVDRALALDPSNALAHKDRGEILLSMGKVDAAEGAFRSAAALDPMVPVIQQDLGVWYMAAGRMDSAIVVTRKAQELDPDNPFWHRTMGMFLAIQGKAEPAIAECSQVTPESFCRAFLGGLLDPAQHSRLLARLGSLGATGPGSAVPPALQASMYAGLGETDSAFARLRIALQPGNEEIYSWINTPWMAALKRDPRWDQIVGTVQRQ